MDIAGLSTGSSQMKVAQEAGMSVMKMAMDTGCKSYSNAGIKCQDDGTINSSAYRW